MEKEKKKESEKRKEIEEKKERVEEEERVEEIEQKNGKHKAQANAHHRIRDSSSESDIPDRHSAILLPQIVIPIHTSNTN